MKASNLSPARQALAQCQTAAAAAAAEAESAGTAHSMATSALGEAQRKLARIEASDRASGASLAERIKLAVSSGGGAVDLMDAPLGAESRGAAEAEAAQATHAANLLQRELDADQERLSDAMASLQGATLKVLAEDVPGLVEDAAEALEKLRRIRWALSAMGAGSWVPAKGGGMQHLAFPMEAQWILRWQLDNGDPGRLPQALRDDAATWRAYRERLLEDASAPPPTTG